MTDADAIRHLVSRWHQTRSWAERLLCERLELGSAGQVLHEPHRGNRPIPGTMWFYRTHGIGVEVTGSGNVGGIDFDFNAPEPDAWRLRDFLVKQYNAGALEKRVFRPLLQDVERWQAAVDSVLGRGLA